MNKLFFIVLNIFFFTVACENDESSSTINQVNVVAQGNCMNASFSGLNATLCITDMEGNPKNSFIQNENFIIALTFENSSGDLIRIEENYLNNDAVMSVLGIDDEHNFGKPFTVAGCMFDLDRYINIEPSDTYVVSSPWVFQDGVYPIGPICKSENNEYLSAGSYKVIVPLDFTMEKGGESIRFEGDDELILEFNIM